jgi:serine protease Do
MSFDGQVVRPPVFQRELYSKFVCVRVTDMRGVDLSRYVFDFDLTFAALMMNADGTIYHRYGSRDHRSSEVWLSEPSLEFVLQQSVHAHANHETAAHAKPPRPSFELATAKAGQPVMMEKIPSYQKRDKGKCIHCHSIHPAFYEEAVAAHKWKPERKWVYPDPARIGIDLNRDQQRSITRVEENSIAANAGLKRRDQILRLNDVAIASVADLMFALDILSPKSGTAKLDVTRDGTPLSMNLKLSDGWKTGTALSFSWRPFKWGLTPAPGFGGPQLTPAELKEIGRDPTNSNNFAFRVQYLVTWNENRRFGQAAAQAGLRKNDIVLSLAGKSDFDSVEHFHSWWRLTRKVGEVVEIEILRGGKKKLLKLKVVE